LLAEGFMPQCRTHPKVRALNPDSALHFTAQAAQLLHSIPGIVLLREGDRRQSVCFASEGCLGLTGYLPAEICGAVESGHAFNHCIYAEDLIELLHRIEDALESHQPYSAEYRFLTKSGQQRWFLEQGYLYPTNSPSQRQVQALVTDISAQKQAQAQLLHDALYDPLTGLPNRSLFIDRLTHAVRRMQRVPDEQFAVLFLDLDRFKVINDSLGHRIGDLLLIQVGERLQSCIRPGDTVARLGGDEFTMLIAQVFSLEDATQVAERILKDMGVPFQIETHEIFTTTSIGVALSSTGYSFPEDLIRDADIALYQAKALGKACYSVFQAGMHIHAVARLQMENDLRRALERQEFCLFFQPIIAMESGRLTGFEAFVYWQHPTRGLLPPGEFLAIAEETGLMIPLGQWVVATACTQISQWHQQFPLARAVFMSVNLSSSEISHPELLSVLERVLAQSGLNPHCLKIEITEGLLLNNSETVVDQLQKIKSLGIHLCIDDFGTGYSALSYLDQFPIDLIKIDRSFVARVETTENLEIVRTILSLARSLDMKAIAEGVESTMQVARLRALGCEFGQGYTFARPMERHQAMLFLEAQFESEADTSITVALPKLFISSRSGRYQLLLVGRTSWSLGRAPESTICLPDRRVSREHAMILKLAQSGEFYFVDLGSRNGSFLNHQRVKMPTLLSNGDIIRIGKTELEFFDEIMPKTLDPQWANAPLVLMHQPSILQGQVWREVLMAQSISIIWQAPDVGLIQTLRQMEAAGDRFPDLLLIDVASFESDLTDFMQWLRLHYEKLPVLLTMGAALPEDARQRARDAGAFDLLSGFHLHGVDLSANSADVAQKVECLLQALHKSVNSEELQQSATSVLQLVIRNETLF
jgi:diguanylate cyclase (GGDEF)-like protein/PAS domain S-box-containing protein